MAGSDHMASTSTASRSSQIPFFRNLPAMRSGLHTGELESKRDEICSIAVHTVARIVAMAEPSETLVSKTQG